MFSFMVLRTLRRIYHYKQKKQPWKTSYSSLTLKNIWDELNFIFILFYGFKDIKKNFSLWTEDVPLKTVLLVSVSFKSSRDELNFPLMECFYDFMDFFMILRTLRRIFHYKQKKHSWKPGLWSPCLWEHQWWESKRW